MVKERTLSPLIGVEQWWRIEYMAANKLFFSYSERSVLSLVERKNPQNTSLNILICHKSMIVFVFFFFYCWSWLHFMISWRIFFITLAELWFFSLFKNLNQNFFFCYKNNLLWSLCISIWLNRKCHLIVWHLILVVSFSSRQNLWNNILKTKKKPFASSY